MKSLKFRPLIKLLVLFVWLVVLALVGVNIFGYLDRSKKVSLELVEAYRPNLNVNLVMQALEVLEED